MQNPAHSLGVLVWVAILLKRYGNYVCICHLCNDKYWGFTGVNTFGVVQNNKQIIDEMNKLYRSRKTTSILTSILIVVT